MAQTNQQLIAEYASQEAPLLPLLHAFHERDGYLSEEALRATSDGLKIPIAELFGTVTFYHHFAREPGGHLAPRVCTGFICRMNGAEELLASLDGATGMPCSGERGPLAVRSASSARAVASAASFSQRIALSAGPCWLYASMRAR